jgi:Rrf2 family protein
MSANSRMTVGVHILSYLVLAQGKRPDPVTSDRIASSVNTNPVVIRRLLGALRERGLVRSRRGASAGWTLARSPAAITLLDVYQAVEGGPLFGFHASTPNQRCPIGRGIQPALSKVYGSLEEQLLRRLSQTTVAQVVADTLR